MAQGEEEANGKKYTTPDLAGGKYLFARVPQPDYRGGERASAGGTTELTEAKNRCASVK
eukprot:CAMPEP_0114564250 /NCGR_PEP_ID=MMETSP0114-20121206/13607_1 /TAXON_ID=31324 /ORGANISM="Goniomonas sp, Strain m" /LENGTH=58 /DNA_ID=CAMNT_0001750279 /DNA_START=93 /DNA_END=267 /DNA_ORIENTATION=+